jgi:hypothetical protein
VQDNSPKEDRHQRCSAHRCNSIVRELLIHADKYEQQGKRQMNADFDP